MRSKKAIINIISSLLLQAVTILSSFIIPRLIIQSFGSNVNGLLESITQFLAFITLLESGVGPVIKSVLYKPIASKDIEEIKKILHASENFFKKVSKLFLVYLLVLCIIYPVFVAKEFDIVFTISLLIIMAISVFAEYYFGMTYNLFLQAKQKTYVVSIIKIGTLIINTIVVIILVCIKSDIRLIKIATACIFILRPILQNMYVKKKYKIVLKKNDGSIKLKQKWDGLAQHIAFTIHSNSDIVILTIFTDTVQVSIYSVYMLVIKGVKNIASSFIGGIDASFGDMIAKGEKETLNNSFKLYELFYFTLNTIIFSNTFLLITPFVKIYTQGISDADYIAPVFANLMVLAEFMHSIRLPYSSITLAAGHFKETMKGAWLEAIINVLLSIILVIKYGIVGVAIGTLTAMLIRTIEFMYHTSKYILNRSIWCTFSRLLVIMVEVIIIFCINYFIGFEQSENYLEWIKNAVILFTISASVVLIINSIVYNKDTKSIIVLIKNFIYRHKKK